MVKTSRILPKNPKRDPSGLLNVFYKPKTSKNSRGYPLIEYIDMKPTWAVPGLLHPNVGEFLLYVKTQWIQETPVGIEKVFNREGKAKTTNKDWNSI